MRFHHCYASCLISLLISGAAAAWADDEVYGPPNLLKTMPTPFGAPVKAAAAAPGTADLRVTAGDASLRLPSAPALPSFQLSDPAAVKPISIGERRLSLPRRSLSERLVGARVYLPGRMVMGKPAEFVIKGKPGSHVALAMADKDSGARPIYGRNLRLGSDRKVVAVGTIPESGILSLSIETPIQGDLIGSNLFFECAIWSARDFSDVELATPVTSEGQEGVKNGVIIAEEKENKGGLKFQADSAIPLNQRSTVPYVDNGRP